MRPESILGIDASLRALGAFVIPCDWDMRPERCKGYTLGVDLPKNASPQQLVERLRMLSVDLVTIVHKHNVRHVWIESYAYGMNTAAHSLGELGGVIKVDLWRETRIVVETGNQSAARKFVYGQMPPRGVGDAQRKAWLFEPLKLAGLPVADHNQSDAAVQALFGADLLGIPVPCNLLGPAEPKAKRSKKARAA
jgi:Holliday junction resolvasome RuvABC endonuclease subunit